MYDSTVGKVNSEGLVRTPDGAMISEAEWNDKMNQIRFLIIRSLLLFPRLSPTLLQGALGPQHPPLLWRPLLDELIEQGLVDKEMGILNTPAGRQRTTTTYSLSPLAFEMLNLPQPRLLDLEQVALVLATEQVQSLKQQQQQQHEATVHGKPQQ